MEDFECPKCGNTNIYLYRKEETSTELSVSHDETSFDYGRESVIDCDVSEIQCGEGHTLTLKDGRTFDDLEGFRKWQEEQE